MDRRFALLVGSKRSLHVCMAVALYQDWIGGHHLKAFSRPWQPKIYTYFPQSSYWMGLCRPLLLGHSLRRLPRFVFLTAPFIIRRNLLPSNPVCVINGSYTIKSSKPRSADNGLAHRNVCIPFPLVLVSISGSVPLVQSFKSRRLLIAPDRYIRTRPGEKCRRQGHPQTYETISYLHIPVFAP